MSSALPSRPTASAIRGLPTGTVTFLFSDIEGSTQRWERDAAAMQNALRRHDELVRSAIAACGGHVFKSIGDGFCAAFADPQRAIAATIAAQRRLAVEDFSAVDGLRVRMALHAGTAEERDADYFGPAVNRIARLLAIGHGGQILVSGTAVELMRDGIPLDVSLRDLGVRRLKDLATPEHVYQLVVPDLPQTFPALRSLDALPNNLRQQLTSFVGREREMAEIKNSLRHHRLVTLVGTGGAGKTRCAEQIGAELVGRFADGVWLVELASITDASLVASVMARALNVPETSKRPVLDMLLGYLKRKRALLIVDNCEHVIDEVRSVIAAMLRSCPDVRILATSRENLNVAGERIYRMPSLPVPPSGEALAVNDVRNYEAALLFAERALASSNAFALTDENVPTIAEICRRLDGIPLAIELAAARVKVLSPQQLLQKLDERFRVLTGGDRSALPRQQTMRALIDWSYDLLSTGERALFRKLSIFAGGFTLDTATAVGTDETTDEITVLDMLSSLVDKSLVQVEPTGSSESRFMLLESTRQYAREKLIGSGEFDIVARAHAMAFMLLAEDFERTYEATPELTWLTKVEPELENWRAAVQWALLDRGDVVTAQRLVGALRWSSSKLAAAERRAWVRTALEMVDPTTSTWIIAKLDLAEAVLDATLTQYKGSYAASQRALARYGDLQDALGTAWAQRYVGSALIYLGQVREGESLEVDALPTARRLQARKLTSLILQDLAYARQLADDLPGARRRYAEALATAKAACAERTAAQVAANLAEAEFRSGDAEGALRLAADALATQRAANNPLSVAIALCNMTAYLVILRRYDEARTHGREALAVSRDLQFEVSLLFTLQHLAAVVAFRVPCVSSAEGEPSGVDHLRAARLLGYVDTRLAALEVQRQFNEQQEYDRLLAMLRNVFGDERLTHLINDGGACSEDHVVTEALLV